MKRLLLVLLTSLLIATGCSKISPTKAQSAPTVDTSANKPALPFDHPPVDAPPPQITSASAQRVSIAQLRGTFPVAMGNNLDGSPITWLYPNNQPGLTVVSTTLGEPNYIDTTEEDLSASPLYLKFMDDAARDVCNRALSADYGRSTPSQRTLIRYADIADTASSNAAGVNKNLRYLKLRFHGVKVADDDDAPIAALRNLFTRGVQASAGANPSTSNDVKEGWRVVCVALVTAPEFHLY
jgi:hypothetical protein